MRGENATGFRAAVWMGMTIAGLSVSAMGAERGELRTAAESREIKRFEE